MKQEEQESRQLAPHIGKQVLIVMRQRRHTPHPIACFSGFDQNGVALVVGTKNKLAEELHLPTVAPFCFGLVAPCGRKVLDPFGIFPTVQQYLVHADQQFTRSVVVELRTEILVGIERHVALEDQLQKIEKGSLACILAGHQQYDRQTLQRT